MKSNLAPNVASALCYLPFVGWIASIVFLIIETNADVRFNAVQSIFLMVAVWLLTIVTAITIFLPPLIWVAGLILQLILVVKAYNKEKMVLPLLGSWSETALSKLKTGK